MFHSCSYATSKGPEREAHHLPVRALGPAEDMVRSNGEIGWTAARGFQEQRIKKTDP